MNNDPLITEAMWKREQDAEGIQNMSGGHLTVFLIE